MGGVLNSCRVPQHEHLTVGRGPTTYLERHSQTPRESSLTYEAVISRLDLAYQNALHRTNDLEIICRRGSLQGIHNTTRQSLSTMRVSFASDSDSVKLIKISDAELSHSSTSCIYSSSSSDSQKRKESRWVTYAQESPNLSSSIIPQTLSQLNASRSRSDSSQLSDVDAPWAVGLLS